MPNLGVLLSSTVIFLFTAGQGGGQVPIGTGFIVGYPVPVKPNSYTALIVTDKHVVGNYEKVYGRFNTQEGKSTGLVEYDLAALRRSGDYWENPDTGVDIVVFRTLNFQQAKYQPVPMELVATKDDFSAASIQTTDRVVYPGLLVNFMGLSKNYPIIRSGSIALMPDELVPMKYQVGTKLVDTRQEVLFIDGTAVAGESGSPVFLWPGPRMVGNSFTVGGTKPLLLGVVHGFYPALPREVSTIQTGTTEVFAENSNVAIVFPSWRIREILATPAFTARMQQVIDQENTVRDNKK